MFEQALFKFKEISGMTLSPDNNLYISNCWTQSILKVDQNTSETAILADSKTI
jgi:hypothetical protein